MGACKANEDNRKIFLNAKQTIMDSGAASNIDIPYDDENYSIACSICSDMRLAFGVKKRQPLAFMKASVKCGRLSEEQIKEVCETLVDGMDRITYEINHDKAIFQTATPLSEDTYEENNNLVFHDLKQFVEVMSKCSHEAMGGEVVTLEYSEYKKRVRKPVSIEPDTEIADEESARKSRNREEALDTLDRVREYEKRSLNTIPLGGSCKKDVRKEESKKEADQMPHISKEGGGRKENSEKKLNNPQKPEQKKHSSFCMGKIEGSLVEQYMRDMAFLDREYKKAMSEMNADDLFSFIEDKYNESGPEVPLFVKEKLCSMAKEVLTERLSGAVGKK